MIPNTDWKPRLMTRIRNWGVWSDATLKQARLSAKIQLYYSEIPFGIWMHGDENSDLELEQGEYLLLYPKLHLQHIGTCRAWKIGFLDHLPNGFSKPTTLCVMWDKHQFHPKPLGLHQQTLDLAMWHYVTYICYGTMCKGTFAKVTTEKFKHRLK